MLARHAQQHHVGISSQRLSTAALPKDSYRCTHCVHVRDASFVVRAAVPGESPRLQYGLVQEVPTYGLEEQVQYGQYEAKQLNAVEQDELEGQPNAPPGLALYETLLVMQPELTDEERDQELARFESFLISLECQDINVNVRGRHRMAYPIKDYWEGNYVIFRYIADPTVPPKRQRQELE